MCIDFAKRWEGVEMLSFTKTTSAKWVWEIRNDREEFLGCICRRHVGRFYHFVFEPYPDTYFTNGCLKEIREFITKCYSEYKDSQKKTNE